MTGAPTDWLMDPAARPSGEPPLEEFLEAAAAGSLSMPFCSLCDRPLDIDQVRCEGCCEGRPTWRQVDLTGRVLAAIEMHRFEKSLVRSTAPYQLVEVELVSGHRLIVSTDEPTSRKYQAGDAIDLGLVEVGGQNVPRIRTERSEGRTS